MKTLLLLRILGAALVASLAFLPACNLTFASKTVRIVGQSSMTFGGSPDCQLTSNGNSLSISWSPAHNANGPVDYSLYQDPALTQLIVNNGTSTSYTWDVSAVEAVRFSVYIVATDNDGASPAISCVIAPPGGAHMPSAPVSGIWVSPAAQDKALVEWDPASVASDIVSIAVYNRDDALYNDQARNTAKRPPLCTTNYNQHYCLVTNLPFSNYQYRFLVRATNSSNFEDHNTNEGTYLDAHGNPLPGGTYTLDHEVAGFTGILDLRKVGGVPGLSSFDVYLLPANSGTLGAPVTGYFVNCQEGADDAIGPFSFLAQTESTTAPFNWSTSPNFGQMYQPAFVSGVPVTKFRIDGFSAGTKYCCNVRAFVESVYSDADHNSQDLNRVTVCQSTNGLVAPSTFSGVTQVRPKAVTGSQLVDYVTASWSPPSTDGVYSEFVLYWQEAPASEEANTSDNTCYAQDWSQNQPNVSAPTNTPVVVDASQTSAQITGLAQGKKYYVKAYTHYRYTDGTGSQVDIYSADTANVANSCTWTNPPPPIFSGLSSVRPAPDTGGVATGNTTLQYTFIKAADPTGSFTDYVMDISPSPALVTTDPTQIQARLANGQSLFANCLLSTDTAPNCPGNIISLSGLQSTVNGTLSGLTPNQKYYMLAFARYYRGGAPYVVAGPTAQSAIKEVQMTPPQALGEAITAINILDPVTIKIAWQAPTTGQYPDINGVTAAGTPLYNLYAVFHKCDDGGSVSPATKITNALAQWNSGQTLSDPSILISNISASSTSYVDTGLPSNMQCCYLMRAYYQDSSYSLHSATSGTTQVTGPFPPNSPPQTGVVCATPKLLPPAWTGISSVAPSVSASGFYSATVKFPALASTDQSNFNFFQADYQLSSYCASNFPSQPIENCFQWNRSSSDVPGVFDTTWTDTQMTLTNRTKAGAFVPNQQYYFAVRAVHMSPSTILDQSTPSIHLGTGAPATVGIDWVWNPTSASWNTVVPESFSYRSVYMHPPTPIMSNTDGQPGAFSVQSNGATGMAMIFTLPSGGPSQTNGLYNTLITVVGNSAANVNGLIGLLDQGLLGGGGAANQIDLFKTLPANYALYAMPSTHTYSVQPDGSGKLFGDSTYQYSAIAFYEPVSDFGSATLATTQLSNFSGAGETMFAVQMLAQIDATHNPLYSLIPDTIPNAKSALLQLSPPNMVGNISYFQTNDFNDFTKVHVYGAQVLNQSNGGGYHTYCEFRIRRDDEGPTGEYLLTRGDPVYDLAGPTYWQDCNNAYSAGFDVTGLVPNHSYWVHERAITIADNQVANYTTTALPGGTMVSSPEAQAASDLPFITQPVRPQGDGIVISPMPTFTPDPSGYYSTTITYTPPTNASATAANYVWVFKAVAANSSTANNANAVTAALSAAVKNEKQLDSLHPSILNPNLVAIIPVASPGNYSGITWTDHYVIAGLYHAYYMIGVYDTDVTSGISTANPSSTYVVSTNVDTLTGDMSWSSGGSSPPLIVKQNFARGDSNGLVSAALSATDAQGNASSDGTTFIKLCFAATGFNPDPTNVDAWQVFYSPSVSTPAFDFTRPWQTVTFGDPARDRTVVGGVLQNPPCLYVGGRGITPGGKAAFIARAYKQAATAPAVSSTFPFSVDTSTQNDINNSAQTVTIPNAQANYAYLPKAYTKLGYDMWLMTTEAVQAASGTNPAISVMPDTGADAGMKLYNCNKSFHEQQNTFDSNNCGSGALGTRTVKSAFNASTPVTGVTWAQAWGLCRQSSVTSGAGQILQRLPSAEEWRRAARVAVENYGSGLVAANQANCNIGSGAVSNAGSHPNCWTGAAGNSTTNLYTQVFDMAGNVAEWVDERIALDDLAGASPTRARFNYPTSALGSPTRYVVGRSMHNGIDNLSRNYQLLSFASSGQVFGLALGSDFTSPGTYQKQYDAEAEQWKDASTSASNIGFRCAAFFPGFFPTESQLQMPVEPVYQATEIQGVASTWTIPKTMYAGQNRPEKIRVTTGSGSTFGSLIPGSINISWTVYNRYDCTGTTNANACAPTPLSGGTYKLLRWEEPNYVDLRGTVPWALNAPDTSASPYNSPLPLDPLAIHNDGTLVLSALPSTLHLVATRYCTSGEVQGGTLITSNWGCSFADNLTNDATSFDSSHLYRYLLVVVGPNGEYSFPRRQRFRSAYLAGAPMSALQSLSMAVPSFRTETGFRLAGVFPVDETYQQTFTGQPGTGGADPQAMVYVPMDRSGLDRDYFEYKNEPSVNTTSQGGQQFLTGGNTGAPFPQTNGATWDPHAGQCLEETARLGASTACENGNGGSVQSKVHVPAGGNYTPAAGSYNLMTYTRADYFAGCSHTAMLSGDNTSGAKYRLHLNSQAEWLAASDWGDLDGSGTISDPEAPSSIIGKTIEQVEGHGTTAGYCNTHAMRILVGEDPSGADINNIYTGGQASPPSYTDQNQMLCASRYGARDMVGNLREFTDAVYADGAGSATILDNGSDGVGTGTSIRYPASTGLTYSSFDIWRGLSDTVGTGASGVDLNGGGMWYSSQEPALAAGGPYPLQMGGDWWADISFGRFTNRVATTPIDDGTANRTYSAGRCAYGW